MTTYCACNTSTRPKADDKGICPKCNLPRTPKAKQTRKAKIGQYEKIARFVYEHDRDVDLPGDDIPDVPEF